MAITAQMVKELRETTGLGMMDCKNALAETNGDMDAAIDLLRKKAGAKVEKKAGRTAAEGVIATATAGAVTAMVEVNSETDFVAKEPQFQNFADSVAAVAAANKITDIAALMDANLDSGESVAKGLEGLIAKLGENMGVRRVTLVDSANTMGTYLHGRKIGVMVEIEGGDEALAKDLAMHIAAADPRPQFITADEVPAEVIEAEREIFTAQAAESGKPADIVAKMVEGRIKKFLGEICLVDQPFVKDPDTRIGKLVESSKARVVSFARFQVGEGIEKKQEDFAAEVAAQVAGK